MSDPCPSFALDLYCAESLLDPYPLYRQLRELGGAVWLEQQKIFALARHKDVKRAMFH